MSVPDDDDDDDGADDATRTTTARLCASSATTTEAYLREDVACGSAECSTHARANARAGCADVLASVVDGAQSRAVGVPPDSRPGGGPRASAGPSK